MVTSFINFNGVLINTRYIKKIYKTSSRYCGNGVNLYYEIRVNVDGTPGTHVETYQDEASRELRFLDICKILECKI